MRLGSTAAKGPQPGSDPYFQSISSTTQEYTGGHSVGCRRVLDFLQRHDVGVQFRQPAGDRRVVGAGPADAALAVAVFDRSSTVEAHFGVCGGLQVIEIVGYRVRDFGSLKMP